MNTRTRHTRNLRRAGIFASLIPGSILVMPANASCSPMAAKRDQLETLQHDKSQLPDDAPRRVIALDPLNCPGTSDPVLRDARACEALSTWMRGKPLTPETLRMNNRKLQGILNLETAVDRLRAEINLDEH